MAVAGRVLGRRMKRLTLEVDDELILEHITLAHPKELFTCVNENRRHIEHWLEFVQNLTTLRATKHFIAHVVYRFDENESPTLGMFSNSELVGMIDTHRIDWANHKTSVSYWVARNH